jgi:DNA-binding response OmpR family regulator
MTTRHGGEGVTAAVSGALRNASNTASVQRRILLCEDDPRVRRVLRLSFEAEGYEVTEAGCGAAGLAELRREPPDVVLLDILLPDVDGFAVCREIRRDSDVPVIMVTARVDSHDIVAGLEAGADDYVTKPFVAKEISARIRALLRRVDSGVPHFVPHIVAGDLEIDPARAQVARGGVPIRLTRTELRLLVELARSDGRVCTREDLLERVWGYGYFGDSRLVDVHIRRLRVKIEADPSHPRHVLTERGLGYRLAS